MVNFSKHCLYVILYLFLVHISVSAQSTYQKVYSIFQSNCVSCHSGPTPSGMLDFSLSETDLYNAIVDANPTNPFALSKGYKLISKGNPERSSILRKIHQGLYNPIVLNPAEGNPMPNALAPLSNRDIDLINAWILYGAPQSGNIHNEARIDDYYNGLGMLSMPVPPKPDTSEGIQVYLGAIFLAPGEEIEYLKKHRLDIPYLSEVTRIEPFLNAFSHHYILYKFADSAAASAYQDRIRQVNSFADFASGRDYLATFQFSHDLQLPQHTAYFWEKNPYLDLNYHIKNYSNDSILRAEVYCNFYYGPRDVNTIEMKTLLVPYPTLPLPYPYTDFLILNNDSIHTFTGQVTDITSMDTTYVWLLSTHTHKYGKDYDIYERNADSSKGTQLYEGFYNTDYTFNQGYYDFTHPPVKYFDPLHPVAASTGFIHEAKYRNNGPSNVTWGLTTNDEMMLFLIQYTTQLPLGSRVNEISSIKSQINIYPNPSHETITIESSIPFKMIQLMDMSGRLVYTHNISTHKVLTKLNMNSIPEGVYFVKVEFQNGEVSTQKIVLY